MEFLLHFMEKHIGFRAALDIFIFLLNALKRPINYFETLNPVGQLFLHDSVARNSRYATC